MLLFLIAARSSMKTDPWDTAIENSHTARGLRRDVVAHFINVIKSYTTSVFVNLAFFLISIMKSLINSYKDLHQLILQAHVCSKCI